MIILNEVPSWKCEKAQIKDHRFLARLKAVDPERLTKQQLIELQKATNKNGFQGYKPEETTGKEPECT